ncbi:MAG: transporter substrate-binding domain-containing protein [Solobacterium sp.]|nr:transporter substrate-binding domain-containing protein [Solobacterium sp.]
MRNSSLFCIRQFTGFLLCIFIILFVLPPVQAKTVVRVGWFEGAFNTTDQFGRRSGYAYEYERKVASYTGWTYEYVEGSWPDLLDMLKRGEIDLMGDVSYTEARSSEMLFSSMPMGTEAYYIFTAPDNEDISSEDFTALDGKTVGVNRGSIQKDYFLDWADKHGIQVNLKELTCAEEESINMLDAGELDALVSVDANADPETAIPLWRIGQSDYYFAVSNNRPELLSELEAALNRIHEENRYYNEQLFEKYMGNHSSSLYLTSQESDWLESHGPIRVGYQDSYLAFCAADPKTGELTGVLKDYLAYASDVIEDENLSFEAIGYPTAAAAMEAMKNGEVDCMFPANLTDYDSENVGVLMSPPLVRTEMDAVVRASDQKEFLRKMQDDEVKAAVNEGNPNYDMFLVDHFPGWEPVYYTDSPACLEAIARGEADCLLISNYRFGNISKQCEKLKLTTVSTGVEMDYCFALNEGETVLYSILSRVTGAVPAAAINTALTYYSTEDVKTSFTDLVKEHFGALMTAVSAVLLVILLLLLRSIRAEKKVNEEMHLVDDLNRRVFVDALTSVRNKGAYNSYIQEIQDRIDQGETLQFGIGVFDCDNLKEINDRNGHDKGDLYLKAASRLICSVFQHSPVFRIGGDEFAVFLQNEDYENRDALIEAFRKEETEISRTAGNDWDQVSVATGIAVYDPQTDRDVNDVARRADQIMYENKRLRKQAKTKKD